MSEPIEPETDQDAGPGVRLRQARERAGLSCEEVAEQLNLTDGQIALLEAESYALLAGPTFVQGYLRSYARLLGLDAAPLLDAYRSQRLAVSAPPPVRRRPSLDHGNFQRYLGLAALVLVLACLWGWQRWSQYTERQDAVVLPAAPASLAPEPPVEIMPAPAALSLDAGLEPVAELVEPSMAEADDPGMAVEGLADSPETAIAPAFENAQQPSVQMRETDPS